MCMPAFYAYVPCAATGAVRNEARVQRRREKRGEFLPLYNVLKSRIVLFISATPPTGRVDTTDHTNVTA